MGGYFKNNSVYWNICAAEGFSQQNLSYWEERIEDLERVQIDNTLYEMSQDNFSELYERIFQKKKSLHLRILGRGKIDLALLSNFTELKSLSIESSEQIMNIEILASFKMLQELHMICDSQISLDFLRDINPSLKKLSIASYNKKKFNLDLTPISNLKKLNHLYLKEYSKNIESAVSELMEIETLALRSITKPKSLDFLSHMKSIRDLIIQSCSFESIEAISRLPNIRYLQLWRLSKLYDLDVVSLLNSLQFLFIETLNGVEKFSDISNLFKLRRIMITSCKNLRDFSGLEKSQSLTDFIIQNASNADITDFIPILTNPNVKDLGIGYQKVSTQQEVAELAAKYDKAIKTYSHPQFENKFEYK